MLPLQCNTLPDCVWLKPGDGYTFSVICSKELPHSRAGTGCHHIEWIRGITAYSVACRESPRQMCVEVRVNSRAGTSGFSASAGMTAQVSPGSCSVRLDAQVHLETLSLLLSDLSGDSCWHLMFHVSATVWS